MQNQHSVPGSISKDYVIKKGQAKIDDRHDKRLSCKSAQVGPNQYIVFNFDEVDDIELSFDLQLHEPKFYRVRELTVHQLDCGEYSYYEFVSTAFLKCTFVSTVLSFLLCF